MPRKRVQRRMPRQRASRVVDYAQSQGVPVPVRIVSNTKYAQQTVGEREKAFNARQPLTQAELETMADAESATSSDLTRQENRQLDELKQRTVFSKPGKSTATAGASARRKAGIPTLQEIRTYDSDSGSSGGFISSGSESAAIAGRGTASRRKDRRGGGDSGLLDRTQSDLSAWTGGGAAGPPPGSGSSGGSGRKRKERRRKQLFGSPREGEFFIGGTPGRSYSSHQQKVVGQIEREQAARDRILAAHRSTYAG